MTVVDSNEDMQTLANPEDTVDTNAGDVAQTTTEVGMVGIDADEEIHRFSDPEMTEPECAVVENGKSVEVHRELVIRKRKRDESVGVFGPEQVERTSPASHAVRQSNSKIDSDMSISSGCNDDDDDDTRDSDASEEESDAEDLLPDLDETQFFSTLSFTTEEREAVEPVICKILEKPLAVLEEQGHSALLAYLKERNEKKVKTEKSELAALTECSEDATIQGDPREYQRILFDIAKEKNTIINLGTGFGKTLIALLCIRHFKSAYDQGKQTLFMVPSVALAVQQSMTLRANLPNFKIQTACYASSNSDSSRQALAKCNVLVATHGAILDLLRHYSDLFHMSRFNLLVIDECHYATGNHAYAVVMKNFYHAIPKDQRPRVLGLTASPLVNVKESHTDEQLAHMLGTLEGVLDSTLVSISGLMPVDRKSDLLLKSAEEQVIPYVGTNIGRSIPSAENLPLHQTRYREFRQLVEVYHNLGPLALSIYCRTLAREISRNSYEKETVDQFNRTVKHLVHIAKFCEQECISSENKGRTDKLVALERLLEEQIEERGGAETVGLVFVERRITALALHNYFIYRSSKLENRQWTRAQKARKARQRASTSMIPKQNIYGEGQFDDADDDPGVVMPLLEQVHQPPVAEQYQPLSKCNISNTTDDQFMDADEEEEGLCDVDVRHLSTRSCGNSKEKEANSRPDANRDDGEEKENLKNYIRTAALVRNSTHIFKSLCIRRKGETEEEDERKANWLHQETKIRDVLNKLRHGDVNVLIATSVVEEGVDVQACSFVAVFDTLKNTKSYIQMKGRARQKNAKFYVFQGVNVDSNTNLSLSLAQRMERRVHRFIETQLKPNLLQPQVLEKAKQDGEMDDSIKLSEEHQALKDGYYKVKRGGVDLDSAKSLLNRYTLSVPLDPFARSSKASLLAHMPVYDSTHLILPSHIPHAFRLVMLPQEYFHHPKKDRHKMLALMACVRLHTFNLLNERLLPLTRRDMQQHILRVATKDIQTISLPPRAVSQSISGERIPIFVYTIEQTSPTLTRYHSILKGKGHTLALVTLSPLEMEFPVFHLQHSEFGVVMNALGAESETTCTAEEHSVLSEIFLLLMNERWRRRTRNMRFKMRDQEDYDSIVGPYLVGIAKGGCLDWDFMRLLLKEASRSAEDRKDCVESVSGALLEPRLWSPVYDQNVSYIVYGPSGETCEAKFPHEKEGITTYQDYFFKHRSFRVEITAKLFEVQRLWNLPSNLPIVMSMEGVETQDPKIKTTSSRYEVCHELSSVKIAQDASIEPTLANADVSLLCALLPQFLFYLERCLVVKAFIQHCKINLPTLGDCVEKLPFNKLFTALTAKSCSLDDSYDKLEWFGDAALKLIQTDALVKSIELRQWIRFLHEGDLSTLRSAMGSNDRLEQICKQLRLDKFILTAPLARGQWTPAAIDFATDAEVNSDPSSGGKLFADIIESLLGLVYVEYGYAMTMKVGDELKVTLPWDNDVDCQVDHKFENRALLDAVRKCTGYGPFRHPELVEEAFTHPSALHPTVPSYQRLEWVGDAVLCLAAREWIFSNFPSMQLGDMVIMESALVSNETLAFLSIRNGMQHHLNHRDHSLPSRIESYDWSIREVGRGLWGADPPKSISDIVESVLGAVHADGGFQAGQNAALSLLAPVLKVMTHARKQNNVLNVKHPKKIMQELGGELLELASATEAEFALTKNGAKVWFGKQWSEASEHGTSYIASIQVLGSTILAVSDPSAAVARNRACALVVATLEKNKKLLERLQAVRVKVECQISTATNLAKRDDPDNGGSD